MTVTGYKNLQNELNKLINQERPAIITAITEARSHGDLSENAEYQYAKEQQSLIEGKIQELESTTALAEIINKKSRKNFYPDELDKSVLKDVVDYLTKEGFYQKYMKTKFCSYNKK